MRAWWLLERLLCHYKLVRLRLNRPPTNGSLIWRHVKGTSNCCRRRQLLTLFMVGGDLNFLLAPVLPRNVIFTFRVYCQRLGGRSLKLSAVSGYMPDCLVNCTLIHM